MMEIIFNIFVTVSFFFVVLYAGRLVLSVLYPKKKEVEEINKHIIIRCEELPDGRIVTSMSGNIDDAVFLNYVKNKFDANDILIDRGENKK